MLLTPAGKKPEDCSTWARKARESFRLDVERMLSVAESGRRERLRESQSQPSAASPARTSVGLGRASGPLRGSSCRIPPS